MKRESVDRKGQMKLSFGMIFSIILIIFFIAFAVYGVSKFLGLKNSAQEGKFKKDFQSKIDRMWKSGTWQSSSVYKGILPRKFSNVCFDSSDGEVTMEILEENKDFGDKKVLEHVKIGSEFCVPNDDGEVKVRLLKERNSPLIEISSL